MKIGTRSILYGVHAFWLHPVTVWIAWVKIYKSFPNWKETVCIFVHDWGYFGKNEMDGPEGETHPELGARIAGKLFGEEYYNLCLYHSRTYASKHNKEPSALCWPDKISILYEPDFFYLFRAHLSGEIEEYRQNAAKFNSIPIALPDKNWIKLAKEQIIRKSYARDVRPAYEEGS